MDQHDCASPPQRRTAHLRHAQHYIALADQADDQYLAGGDNITVGLALFDRERKQLDVARHRLQGYARDPEIDALLIADAKATAHIGDLRYGKQKERIQQLEQALQAAQRRGDQAVQGLCLSNLGSAYALLGETCQAIEFHQQHIALARAIDDRQGEATALGNLGNTYTLLGEIRQAIDCYQQALALARITNDQRGETNVLGNLGNSYAALGDTHTAMDFYQQALALAHALGDWRSKATTLGHLGNVYAVLGDTHKAIKFYQQALDLARAIGDRDGEANALSDLGNAYASLSDVHQAIDVYQQILTFARDNNDRRRETTALGNLGRTYAALGDTQRAIVLYQQTLALARALGDKRDEAATLGNLANAYAALGDVRQSIEFNQEHLALARTIGDRRGEGVALGNLGNAYHILGDIHRAIDFHHQALAISRETGDRRAESQDLGNLGAAYADLGDTHKAINFQQQRLMISCVIGDRSGEAVALGNLGSVYTLLGDTHRAIDFYQRYLVLVRGIGDRHGEATALLHLGVAYALQKDTRQAIDFYQQHLTLARTTDDRHGEAIANWNYGIALVRQGEPAQGLPLLEAGLVFYQQIDHPYTTSMASDIAHIRAYGILPKENDTQITVEILAGMQPEPHAALEQDDQDPLQTVLESLPDDHQRPDPRELFATLLRSIAAVAAGDDGLRQLVEADLVEMEQGGWMLREPVARLWTGERDRDALMAGLDGLDRLLIERTLELTSAFERGELRTPSQIVAELPEAVRVALESDDEVAIDIAIAVLDEAEQARVNALLDELSGEIEEEAELPTGLTHDQYTALLATLPEAVRAVIEQNDEPALQAALANLPEVEASVLTEQLQRAGIIASPSQSDIDQVVQQLLPLLGDIALAALGDATARQIAEAMLLGLEEQGWHIRDATQCIWAGERDVTALTEGLDAQDSALVQQTLRLIAGGRDLIGVAYSREVERARQQADSTFARTHTSNSDEREALATDLDTSAGQIEEWPGAPWQALAAHLRGLAAQLRLPHEHRSPDGPA